MAVDSIQFRSTLAQWSSGVTVVTALLDDRRYGMTASSFSSVSLDPPLILVCVGKEAYSHQILLDAGHFGVNILSAAQADLGRRFSAKTIDYEDRFTDLTVVTGTTGSPMLPDVVAWLDCRTVQHVEAGDHTIFIGEVLESQVNGGAPLLYMNRKWGTFREIE